MTLFLQLVVSNVVQSVYDPYGVAPSSGVQRACSSFRGHFTKLKQIFLSIEMLFIHEMFRI